MIVGKHKKLIAAFVGFLVLFLKDLFGIDIPNETADNLLEGIISLIDLIFVYALANSRNKS